MPGSLLNPGIKTSLALKHIRIEPHPWAWVWGQANNLVSAPHVNPFPTQVCSGPGETLKKSVSRRLVVIWEQERRPRRGRVLERSRRLRRRGVGDARGRLVPPGARGLGDCGAQDPAGGSRGAIARARGSRVAPPRSPRNRERRGAAENHAETDRGPEVAVVAATARAPEEAVT